LFKFFFLILSAWMTVGLKGFYSYKKKMIVMLILRPGFIDFELGEKE